MMQKIRLSSLVLVSLLSLNVFALGTGNANLHSHLGEKLLVEIPLKGASELTDEEILVKLASLENYERLGVEYHAQHQQLKFKTIRDENNQAIIVISTKDPFSEPFLNFVLHIKTPESGIIKEFSLLLDTP